MLNGENEVMGLKIPIFDLAQI
ncbi:hypothetical protein EMIT0P43_70066 [Pseudomonas jessenii]